MTNENSHAERETADQHREFVTYTTGKDYPLKYVKKFYQVNLKKQTKKKKRLNSKVDKKMSKQFIVKGTKC